MINNIDERLGWVELSPHGAVTAGRMMEWKLIYTAGSYGVDEGGMLMLVQRMASDMQKPQFEFPDQDAYTTVSTTADCCLSYRFQTKQYKRPWQKWCMVIDIEDGSLKPGDKITIVLGDRSKGSLGIRAQTFVESRHEFRILVDPTNAADPRPLNSSPIFSVVAGEPVSLTCLMPTQMMLGDTTEIFVKGQDKWGNPTPCPKDLRLKVCGSGEAVIEDRILKALHPGFVYIEAQAEEMICKSNPVQIIDKAPRYFHYWGDLHAQTDSTVGTGSEEEYFSFARKESRLDFSSHQGNDFQMTDENWNRLNRVISRHHKPGEFVIFPGYEWSGNTAAGGDHNVIYLYENQPILRSSHWQVPEVPEDDMSPAHPADNLFKKLKRIGNVMVIPHVGGRPANVSQFFDPEIEHLVEILSCHGVFEWLLWDALEQGHKVGVVCNSDGHKGRPGAEGPGAGQFGIYGGLTCVLAKQLTREAIFNALNARRCYGTTGARMYLWFEIDGHIMGEAFEADGKIMAKAEVHGTAPIEKIILMSGREVLYTVWPSLFEDVKSSPRIRISWEGARIRGRARRATWDGRITVRGTRYTKVRSFAFDSPADGIVSQSDTVVVFKSSTTGDADGIDLFLERTDCGTISFESELGNAVLNLAELNQTQKVFKFEGLDLMVRIQRYPEKLESTSLSMECSINPKPGDLNAFLIKAVQEDGQTAWASPIFVDMKA